MKTVSMPLEEYQKELADHANKIEIRSYTRGATDMARLVIDRINGREDGFFNNNPDATKALTQLLEEIQKDKVRSMVRYG